MDRSLDSENIMKNNDSMSNESAAFSNEEIVEKTEEMPVVTETEESTETPVDVETPDDVTEKEPDELPDEKSEAKKTTVPLSKQEIIEKLSIAVEKEITNEIKAEVEALRQSFYKIKRQETEAEKKLFVEAGGIEDDFKPEEDELELKFKELLSVFREKKAEIIQQIEQEKEQNLLLKIQIIEKIKDLSEKTDEDFYKVYNEFRKLQQDWKEIKKIPQTEANAIWKEFQHYSEKFYDLLKINNEMRDYDFKKNLELKQALCESVERLDAEKDIVSAFHQVQKFHQDWKEIGPVSRELREEIWTRFKNASTIISKKHQEHFEELRGMEQRNLEEKTAFCEAVEAIDCSTLKTIKEWDTQNKYVIELQEKWKAIGFAPKKHNQKIFERFRAACDAYFKNRKEFFAGIKENQEANLQKKISLCEKAEAMKDDQNWKETTDKFIALQKEWKETGPAPKKHSETVWKRFIAACDHFFEQKNTHFSSQKTEEVENLKKKKEIIEKIDQIDEALPANEAIKMIRGLMAEWNSVGFVPFRDKEKIQKDFRKAVNKHFDRLKVDEAERRLQAFKSNLGDMSSGGGRSKNKLLSEREKLMRVYERLKSDIQTYENNIGFLSVSSKGGGGLVKEMNRKIESLKEELNLIVKKIELIDENFENN